MKPIIHLGMISDQYPGGAVERVKSMALDYEVLVTTDRKTIETHLDRIEITFGRFAQEFIKEAPLLKWRQQTGAGADWLERLPEVRSLPFTLTNASGVHSIPISEHLLAMLLSLCRGLPASIRAQMEHAWSGFGGREVVELAGLRVLVLGVGAIGARFARLCAACEMEVVGLRRESSRGAEGVSRMVGASDLLHELSLADVVANTLPLTPETRHIICRPEFDIMKPGAIILNIGRGSTIDEAAMIDALKSGKVRGAGFDVFETEPLPADSPLWEMDNVIITSHFAGSTPMYAKRAYEIFIDNLERYLRGEPLRNVVVKELGY